MMYGLMLGTKFDQTLAVRAPDGTTLIRSPLAAGDSVTFQRTVHGLEIAFYREVGNKRVVVPSAGSDDSKLIIDADLVALDDMQFEMFVARLAQLLAATSGLPLLLRGRSDVTWEFYCLPPSAA